jgi:putative transposase
MGRRRPRPGARPRAQAVALDWGIFSQHFRGEFTQQLQMRRIRQHFPLSHGIPRVDDRRVLSGIIFVIEGGLRWRDAPPGYGSHKTLYNRFVRWSRMGVFSQIFAALAGEAREPDRLIIDSTHLKAHRGQPT